MDQDERLAGTGARPQHGADDAEFITLARVTKTQGRRGEVAATLFTNFPELFTSRRQLFGLDSKGRRQELKLEGHWPHKGHVVLKFAGVESINQAEMLIGWEIQIPRSQRAPLEAGEVYISDLIGCTVYDRGREIGKVLDVQLGSGEAPLLVVQGDVQGGVDQGNQEHLIPFASSYIEELALDQKQLKMKLPEGLLEVSLPLKKDVSRKTGTEQL